MNPAVPGRSSRDTIPQVSGVRTREDSFSTYDIAAGDDFLVSATPALLANHQAVGGNSGHVGMPDRYLGFYKSRAIGDVFSTNRTPAETSGEDAAAADRGGTLVTLPVDFALAPGAYALAMISDDSLEANGQTDLFGAASVDGGTCRFGLGRAQTMPPAADLSYHLYAVSAVPELTLDTPFQRQGLAK